MGVDTELLKKPAPTLYGIIALKLVKGGLLVMLAVTAYTLSDNDLPAEYRHLLRFLHFDPEKKFFIALGATLQSVTETKALWVAAGTLLYSLFSLVEGIGLIFRVGWAGWMAIVESAFFIPIEVFELMHHFSKTVFIILIINIVIVWYLFQNRHRLFRHHQPHQPEAHLPDE